MPDAHHRLVSLALALASFGCGDRLADLSQDELEPETVPVCMLIAGTRGYWHDGTRGIVWDPEIAVTPAICECMTTERLELPAEEFWATLDDLNDQMLAECERLSALRGFESDDCLEDYESGLWRHMTVRALPGDYWGFLVPPDLDCE